MHNLIEFTLHKRNFVFATELKSVKLTSESETLPRKELTPSYNRSKKLGMHNYDTISCQINDVFTFFMHDHSMTLCCTSTQPTKIQQH